MEIIALSGISFLLFGCSENPEIGGQEEMVQLTPEGNVPSGTINESRVDLENKLEVCKADKGSLEKQVAALAKTGEMCKTEKGSLQKQVTDLTKTGEVCKTNKGRLEKQVTGLTKTGEVCKTNKGSLEKKVAALMKAGKLCVENNVSLKGDIQELEEFLSSPEVERYLDELEKRRGREDAHIEDLINNGVKYTTKFKKSSLCSENTINQFLPNPEDRKKANNICKNIDNNIRQCITKCREDDVVCVNQENIENPFIFIPMPDFPVDKTIKKISCIEAYSGLKYLNDRL